jgi:hypothetical protein
MKRPFIFAISVLIVLAICLTSCGANKVSVYEITEENAWQVYSADAAPALAARTGETVYTFKAVYGGSDYRLCVGDVYSESEVYSVSGVGIWFLEADPVCAAWCEMSPEARTFKAYDAGSRTVKEIFRADIDKGFQCANVGVYGGGVYFAYIDYGAGKADVMRYDVESGEAESFLPLEYRGEYSCTSLSVCGGMLLASYGSGGEAGIIALDLETGEKSAVSLKADFIFGCSYDSVTSDYALYYRDTRGKEHIGILKNGTKAIKNIFTFGENLYAYQDKVEIYGGHVYWVNQANVTGHVAQHYRFIDFDYISGVTDEYLRTFGFSLAEDGVILLCFNADEYEAVYFTEIYLGGNKK